MSRQKYGKAHNGQPSGAAYARSRSFFRSVKHLITKPFFMEEFTRAMHDEHFSLTIQDDCLTFVEVAQKKEPTLHELKAFYWEHHRDETEG